MAFDYSKLRGKIKEICGTQETLAHKIGISKASLSDKLNEKSDFSHGEITCICKILGIPLNQVELYFFTEKVKQP